MAARLARHLASLPAALAPLLLAGVGGCAPEAADDTGGGDAAWVWDLPPGFPEPYVPPDNPMSTAKVELGRRLFYDVRLSGNETQSCGSCHLQALAFTDGLAHAVGSTGEEHRRSSMALGNVGYMAGLTWSSNLVRTLEHQALLPLFGETPVELGMSGREDELLARLAADGDYVERFGASFPDAEETVSLAHVADALASFERALISGRSRYDRYTYDGDADALTDSEVRGRGLFFSEQLECSHCHGTFLFADASRHAGTTFDELTFHNTGLYNVDGAGAYPTVDQGLIELTDVASDMGRFRAPSLRNVALTAPYMHDGSAATLDDVLDHYAAGGRTIPDGPNAGVGSANPYKSELINGFELSAQDREDLKAFLGALTDEELLVDPRFADPFAE